MKTATVAIGGNALLRSDEEGTIEHQERNARETVRHLVGLVKEGYDLVITHGNGPQVGAILLQNDLARKHVPPMPLDVCGAESQGQIGYLLQQALCNSLRKEGLDHDVVSIVTRVLVDENDPAFSNPTKFIGPFYNEAEANALKRKGWTMKEDPRGGYRRVVPSPEPVDIVEKEAITRLIFGEGRTIVIAAGGGGIPVVKHAGGYKGVEAVVDKDLASSVLASSIGEKLFIILTDIPHVCKNYGTPEEGALGVLTVEEAKRLYDEGHFPPGSMGPKIRAAVQFLEKGGEKVIITSPDMVREALTGRVGTSIARTV